MSFKEEKIKNKKKGEGRQLLLNGVNVGLVALGVPSWVDAEEK
jgi:hypothetical protein